ncbi:MAG: preprotein translocase subunit SecE [candidate division Zixibacteria bacterium]
MQKIVKFLKETKAEMIKVTWPTRQEIVGSTIVTVVVAIIVSIFIGIVDFALDKIVRTIF